MIKRELILFTLVGSLTALLDFILYRGLATQLLNPDWAKAIGFLAGTLFAYIANRSWTFGKKQHTQGRLWRFILLYTSTCIINVCVNACALLLCAGIPMAIQFSFLLATGLSACLNFVGMKQFVFNRSAATKELA